MRNLLWIGGLAAIGMGAVLGVAGQKAAVRGVKSAPKSVQIDLDKAIAVALPTPNDLKAVKFTTKDGKTGWLVRIPGNRPIATPAYADGRIFVGGGFGSNEFYAFDANTGALAWKIHTSDDGPTAAVVEDGCVAFNTESCTVIITEARTGRLLWQEWLGDPLMSQPAISRGKLYMAYPAGQHGHPVDRIRGYGFRLLCADLHTGKHFWEQEIPTDVISAPIVEGDAVYLTCMNGASFCLDANTGEVRWKKQNSGSSAPIIVDGQVMMTQKEVAGGKTVEGLRRLDTKKGDSKDRTLLASGSAKYLKKDQGGGVALGGASAKALDTSVGFAAAPASAGLSSANSQLGVNSVVGAWSYQGSRAAHANGQFFNAQGANLNSVSVGGKTNWRAQVHGKQVLSDQQLFSPPALGAKNMYLTSATGHLVAVGQSDGSPKFLYDLKQPMVFQPTLAKGNIYVGTATGLLVCLRTGDNDADGWAMWGGNAQHNKVSKNKKQVR